MRAPFRMQNILFITYLLQHEEPQSEPLSQQLSSQVQLLSQPVQVQLSQVQISQEHAADFTFAVLLYSYALAAPIALENTTAARAAKITFFIYC